MKVLITEKQYRRLLEQTEEPEVYRIPSLKYFNNDWNMLQEYLKSEGNPPYTIGGDLDLYGTNITSLGNLISVGGWLDLRDTNITSLGNLQSVGGYLDLYGTNITSLGNLISVGGWLDLRRTNITSLGNLISVGGNLFLIGTPLSKKYSEKDIRDMINVDGNIYI